ncbi:electron transporter SenC [Croceicoccus estronivorus]|nr:electron transporter SenC [Croceicoccus estronivorus]
MEGLKALRMFLWLAVVLIGALALFAIFGGERHSAPQQRTTFADTVGGPFTLTAPDGSAVSDQTLAGKPFAIFFGFTRCPDVCPTTLSRLAQLRQRMGTDGSKFAIVFVSLDPEHDSPEDIGRYVALFDTPIIGLTGTDTQLAQIVKAYHVYYEKVPVEGGGYTIDHTAAVYLMGADGKLQSIIDHHEGADASLAKLRRLVK